MRRRADLLHPFLIALFPVLSLTAQNAADVSFRDVWQAAVFSLLGALALLGVLRLVFRDWPKAALATSIGLILFFSYGHAYDALHAATGVRHRVVVPATGFLFVAAGVLLWRTRRDVAGLARGVTLIAALLVAQSAARIAWERLGPRPQPAIPRATAHATLPGKNSSGARLPDIYYLILDGYASTETLRSVYGFDNGDFVSSLEAKGFYVASQSHSNYSMTPLSLASSLNMEYLDAMARAMGPETKNVRPLHKLIESNRVVGLLRAQGYKFVSFQSGWLVTAANENADLDVNCGGWREFSRVLARTTLLQSLGVLDRIDEESRTRILCIFDTLKQIPRRIPGPRFVFAHIVAPHPPYLFGRNGERVEGATETGEARWEDKPRYIDQLVFCNRKVESVLDRILAQPGVPPIVILQSDHGSASNGYESGSDALLRERLGILNAYRLPKGSAGLYPSITPVNTFRVVLNQTLGANLPMLEDRSYFSLYSHPYALTEVTAKVAARRPAPETAP